MVERFHLPATGKDPLLRRGKVRKDLGSLGKPLLTQHITPSTSYHHMFQSRTFSEDSQNFYEDYPNTLQLNLINKL